MTPGRPVHVHAHVDQPGHDLLDLLFGGPLFHYYDHGFRCLPRYVSRVALTVRGASSPCTHPALEPPRLVDDPLEQPADRVGPERALDGHAPHVLDAPASRDPADTPATPSVFFSRPISHATRARSFSRRTITSSTRSMSVRKSSSVGIDLDAPFSQRTYVSTRSSRSGDRFAGLGNQRDKRAADDRRVSVGRHLRDVFRTRNPEPQRDRQRRLRRECAAPAPRRRTPPVARPGDAEPGDAVQKAAAQLAPPSESARRSSSGSRGRSYQDLPPRVFRGILPPPRSAGRAPALRRPRPCGRRRERGQRPCATADWRS